ncbi:MAG: N-acetylmuramoyl-L-alanine amidase [Chloroflexia bacterium]
MLIHRRLSVLLLVLTSLLTAQPSSNAARPLDDNGSSTVGLASTAAPQHTLRVALQVGHYRNNELPPQLSSLSGHTGAAGGGRREVDLNQEVAGRIARLLRAHGVVVDILPATVPTGYTSDAFVALHADGNASISSRGFKISTRWQSEVAQQDGMLVQLLSDAYRSVTRLPEDHLVSRNMRGYYAYAPWRPNYRVSNFTPGAIVEMGFMTNAADREVMFKQTDKVSAGIAAGILVFLKTAYLRPAGTLAYGHGILDDDTYPDSMAQRIPGTPGTGGNPSRVVEGDWQAYFMGKPLIEVYSSPGGGSVIGALPRGRFHHTTMRNGDYYRFTLPNGQTGWVHRNAIITQM